MCKHLHTSQLPAFIYMMSCKPSSSYMLLCIDTCAGVHRQTQSHHVHLLTYQLPSPRLMALNTFPKDYKFRGLSQTVQAIFNELLSGIVASLLWGSRVEEKNMLNSVIEEACRCLQTISNAESACRYLALSPEWKAIVYNMCPSHQPLPALLSLEEFRPTFTKRRRASRDEGAEVYDVGLRGNREHTRPIQLLIVRKLVLITLVVSTNVHRNSSNHQENNLVAAGLEDPIAYICNCIASRVERHQRELPTGEWSQQLTHEVLMTMSMLRGVSVVEGSYAQEKTASVLSLCVKEIAREIIHGATKFNTPIVVVLEFILVLQGIAQARLPAILPYEVSRTQSTHAT